jgi:hypothetical protein
MTCGGWDFRRRWQSVLPVNLDLAIQLSLQRWRGSVGIWLAAEPDSGRAGYVSQRPEQTLLYEIIRRHHPRSWRNSG